MNNLMRLELKRNNVKTYVMASVIIGIVMLGFLYLFAYAPHIDADPDLQIFTGYNNIISLFSILSMAVFATLSSVMYTKFVIDEYKDKRILLLFSYPVKREFVFLAKILVVVSFTMLANVVCNAIIFLIFSISESIFPLVEETFSVSVIFRAVKMTIFSGIVAAGIGILSMGIGFIKKSVPSTIVSAVILSSLFCNIIFNSTNNIERMDLASIIFGIVILIASLISAFIVTQKVKKMEVE